MQFSFCKKSVFSILFLLSFLFGTICGVLLFRFLYVLHDGWLEQYGELLVYRSSGFGFSFVFTSFLPFMALFLLGIIPEGYQIVPVLIAIRGCLLSYFLSFCQICGASSGIMFYRNLVLLPIFYLISRYLWVHHSFHREIL